MTLPSPAERAQGRVPPSFLVFLALMTSVIALTVDAILPALAAISDDLDFARENDRQLIVINVLLGMGAAQLVFGALADAIGRKPTAMLGWAIFLLGTVMAVAGGSAFWMLAGRFLQGFGAGAPRVVGTTIARDLYGGRPLARVLSLVMTVFMAVPIIAPLAGQGIMAAAGWEAIFGLYFLLAVISGGWYLLGVPETLAPEHRRPLRLGQMLSAYAEVLTTRQTLGCALATALVFGPFVVYLATAQQVLEELYQLGPLFPLAFSSVAVAFAAATFLNAQIVMRVGMRRAAVAGFAIIIAVSSAVALGMLSGLISPVPPIWAYLGLICAIFMAVAILMTNLTALALDPMGHLSGTASAVINATSALGSSLIGLVIAQLYDGTLLPMFLGFSVLGLSGFALCLWATARSEAHG